MIYACLRIIDMKPCIKPSVDDDLEKCCFEVLMNSVLNEIFDDLSSISGQKSLHESFRHLSLENFGTNCSLIGVIKHEIWHFW